MTGEVSQPAPIHSAESLGAMVRSRRKAMGLTIEDVVDLTGLGNRFLVELENGKPTVRLDKLLVVLRSLGIELTGTVASTANCKSDIADANAILCARQQARAEKLSRDRQLRRMHQRVSRLLANEQRAAGLIEKASAMVSQWETKQTCSPEYIRKWREVLADPVRGMRDVVLARGAPYGMAMMHNTPFGFLVTGDAKPRST